MSRYENAVNKLNLKELVEHAHINHVPIIKEISCNLLIKTLKKHKPQTVLEIGTAIGFSGSIILHCLPNAFLQTVDINFERQQIAMKTFETLNFSKRVEMHLKDAEQLLNELQPESLEFVFLDGPKAQYLKYLPLILKTLKPKGVIFCDNVDYEQYFDEFGVAKKKVRTIAVNLKKFIELVKLDKNLKTKIYNANDGVAIIQKMR